MQDNLFDQLVTKLRTQAEIAQVLVCLEEFTRTFFTAKTLDDQQKLFRRLPKELADFLIASFVTEPITPTNQISVKRKIDGLTNQLRKCQNIQITLAFQPDEETITLFSEWVKKNFKPDMMIDLQYDKSIVGGALVVAGGKYKDYSVRKNLAARFRIQRDEIMDLLT